MRSTKPQISDEHIAMAMACSDFSEQLFLFFHFLFCLLFACHITLIFFFWTCVAHWSPVLLLHFFCLLFWGTTTIAHPNCFTKATIVSFPFGSFGWVLLLNYDDKTFCKTHYLIECIVMIFIWYISLSLSLFLCLCLFRFLKRCVMMLWDILFASILIVVAFLYFHSHFFVCLVLVIYLSFIWFGNINIHFVTDTNQNKAHTYGTQLPKNNIKN